MEWVRVAAAADVPEDGTLPVRFRGEPVCLYNFGGRIYATHDRGRSGRTQARQQSNA
jgi:nitrite reductase/ring-hydroxylating ferredoxin subunit